MEYIFEIGLLLLSLFFDLAGILLFTAVIVTGFILVAVFLAWTTGETVTWTCGGYTHCFRHFQYRRVPVVRINR